MSEDEQLVREHWKRVLYCEGGLTPQGPSYVTISSDDHPTAGSLIFMRHGADKETVFSAAADYTRARLEEIRQVERELELLRPALGDDEEWNGWIKNGWGSTAFRAQNIRDRAGWTRIHAREQDALAKLKKGMKP